MSSTIKTLVNDNSTTAFIETLADDDKKKDAYTLLHLLKNITGESPKMWGSSIIGYGTYHYKSERSNQEGDWPLIGFSPRKHSLSLYIMTGIENFAPLLQYLGKHKTGKGCLYINKLEDIDMNVLEKLLREAFDSAKRELQ